MASDDKAPPEVAAPGPKSDPDFMLSLARGLAVIRVFDIEERALSIADIARLAQLSRAAARRCMHTLEVLGYAMHQHGRYELTPAVLALGHACFGSIPLPLIAQPVLDRVCDQLQESTSVAMLDADQVVKIACSFTRRFVSVGLPVGQRSPAYCTALGRVMLAWANEDERARFCARVPLVRHTAFTIVDRQALLTELACVRVRGFSYVQQELELSVSAVAVPIRRFDGSVVAAISAVFPAPGPDEITIERGFVPALQAAATDIGSALR